MTGQWRPVGSAALVGMLCTAVLFGLSLTLSTAQMAGVAHSQRGPSSALVGTPTAAPSSSPSMDPDPTDVASAPRGSSRGPGGLPAAPLATIADPQAVASGVVRQGAFCARAAVAQIGYTSSGTAMICSYGDGEDQPRWRAIPVDQAEPTKSKPPSAKPSDEEPSPGEQADEESEDEEPSNGEPTDEEPTTSKPPSTTQVSPSSQSSARSATQVLAPRA